MLVGAGLAGLGLVFLLRSRREEEEELTETPLPFPGPMVAGEARRLEVQYRLD